MNYRRTQTSPLGSLLILVALALGVVAIALWRVPPDASIIAAATAGACILLAVCMWQLTVEDQGESLRVRFGPLPMLGTSITYSAIASAEPARSAIIDGWGIHYIPGRGWTFNLWGRECVVIRRVSGSIVRIGTDDAESLAAFIRSRLTARSVPRSSATGG